MAQTRSRERKLLITQRPEDFAINFMDRRSRKGVRCSLWDWAGKVNNNQKSSGRGLTGGFRQR